MPVLQVLLTEVEERRGAVIEQEVERLAAIVARQQHNPVDRTPVLRREDNVASGGVGSVVDQEHPVREVRAA
jgi:hypothetical protein